MVRFWSVEEISDKVFTKERDCNKHFVENTRRLESGQYEVRLPMKSDSEPRCESFELAMSKLLKLEQRLFEQPQIRDRYIAFMSECKEWGHMMPGDVVEEEAKRKNSLHSICRTMA